jgi:hypothetical protein
MEGLEGSMHLPYSQTTPGPQPSEMGAIMMELVNSASWRTIEQRRARRESIQNHLMYHLVER